MDKYFWQRYNSIAQNHLQFQLLQEKGNMKYTNKKVRKILTNAQKMFKGWK